MLDRDKLARVLGMLGSAHDGEIAAAARAADALVRQSGLTWFQVINAPEGVPARPRNDQDCICACLAAGGLSAWECSFLTTLLRRDRGLSFKQRICLERICRRVGVPP